MVHSVLETDGLRLAITCFHIADANVDGFLILVVVLGRDWALADAS